MNENEYEKRELQVKSLLREKGMSEEGVSTFFKKLGEKTK